MTTQLDSYVFFPMKLAHANTLGRYAYTKNCKPQSLKTFLVARILVSFSSFQIKFIIKYQRTTYFHIYKILVTTQKSKCRIYKSEI